MSTKSETSTSEAPVIRCESVYMIFGDNAHSMLEQANGVVDAAKFHEAGCIVGVNNASFEVYEGELLIIMGLSGSGKSTLTAWLASQNCSYLTDELIFISLYDPRIIEYFSRPLCLKPGSLHLMENMLGTRQTDDILLDGHGAVMPHRLLASDFKVPLSPPSMIILPDYRPDSTAALESLSRAQLATQLMGCHVNARNLADHGFKQVFDIARSTPAYRLTYNNLQDAEHLLNEFL